MVRVLSKVFPWDPDMFYPSLLLFDRLIVEADSALDFVIGTLDISKYTGLPHSDVVNLIKDGAIAPIISATSRDEMKASHLLLKSHGGGRTQRDAIFDLRELHQLMIDDDIVDWLSRLPTKVRAGLREILDPTASYTRRYRFMYDRTAKSALYLRIMEAQRTASEVFDELRSSSSNPKMFDLFDDLQVSMSVARAFGCSVLETASNIETIKNLFDVSRSEILRFAQVKKCYVDTKELLAFKNIIHGVELRLPPVLTYDQIRDFRKDSAHLHLAKWIDSVRLESQGNSELNFDGHLVGEFNELADTLRVEISHKSAGAAAVVTALSTYVSTLNAYLPVTIAAFLASYFPFTYLFSKLYKKMGKSNFVFHFLDWRKPPVR